MTQNPYLQHLVSDPNFGYLFPHRLAIAAFGVPNEYQLRKFLPQLVNGQHFVKIRGNDSIERLFYSLAGLIALADLIATPTAQAFKADLVAATQAATQPMAIVPAQSQTIQAQPGSNALYVEPVSQFPIGQTINPITGMIEPASLPYPANLPPDHPITMLTQTLTPHLERAIERSVAARIPSPVPAVPAVSHLQTPPDTAALIFEAQRMAGEQQQQTTDNLLKAQALVANVRSDDRPNVQVNLKTEAWIDRQDPWALSLIAVSLFILVGFTSFFLISAIAPRQSYRPINTQYVEVR